MLASIPSPPDNGLHPGPLFVHAYGLAYVVAVLAAVTITTRRWEVRGGSRELVGEVALWGFPAGLVGGRLYLVARTEPPVDMGDPHGERRPRHPFGGRHLTKVPAREGADDGPRRTRERSRVKHAGHG
jgi:hypothetical protein